MPRRLRSDRQTGWFHVTNRGAGRQVVFRSDADRVDFTNLLGAGHDRFGVVVLAYCLMDNHYHLVLSCPEAGLSEFMQLVGGQYTRHANERAGRDGPIFRGRFFSRPVESERYLANAVRYVHRNPLDLGPATGLESFRWSSHRTYLGFSRRPYWLSCSPVLDWFESTAGYRSFVSSVVGVPDRIDAPGAAVWEALLHVADEAGAHVDRAPQGLARSAAYLMIDRLTDRSRSELAAILGAGDGESLKQAIRRASRQATSHPVLTWIADRACLLVADVQVVSDTT